MIFYMRHKPPRSPPTDPLSQLPTELLQNISSLLPLSSRAALSLTSKRIRAIVGPEYEQLSSSVAERSDFLALIEPNFRHHFLCRGCGVLHTRKHFDRWEALNNRGPWPATCFKDTTAQRFGSGFTLHFHHLYLVMQKHRLGSAYGISTKCLKTWLTSSIDLNCRYNTKTSAAITAAGELILRAEYVFWRPKPMTPNWREGNITTEYWSKICPHLSVSELRGQNGSLSDTIKSIIERAGDHPVQYHGITRCLYCPTEFEARLTQTKKNRSQVQIVAWTNLGRGERVDDPNWVAVSTSVKARTIPRSPVWVWQEGILRDDYDAALRDKKKIKRMADEERRYSEARAAMGLGTDT
ncbi:hypothetical protein BU16DRAFT_368420 [Lophium mytilinum]|uniref:F-box domain-containing protein n=1 Tax=Lophium mytilinum TaxID=390894 RepID=A0A6A6QYN0_9PEZI|nr:hypothetical protein BU16DRAFT_368420 [Lophium mytilinum]